MKLNFLELSNHFIYDQLQIEEALLRSDDQNWCLVNHGSSDAIVMGASGKVNELIDVKLALHRKVPIIKRFSGGGTVYVDKNTLFVTFIFNHFGFNFLSFPEPILRWSESLYREALRIPDFHLQENDFTIGNQKIGGNAQYIRKTRWLLHTSFLWDFSLENMQNLLHPPKMPKYRKDRPYDQFLSCLKPFFPTKADFIQQIKSSLSHKFELKKAFSNQVLPLLASPFKQTLQKITLKR